MNKPREFWINIYENCSVFVAHNNQIRAERDRGRGFEEEIHVIEYSAYEDSIKESSSWQMTAFGHLKQLEKAKERKNHAILAAQDIQKHYFELKAERDILLSKQSQYESTLKETMKERDEAKECYQLQKDAFNLMKEAAESFRADLAKEIKARISITGETIKQAEVIATLRADLKLAVSLVESLYSEIEHGDEKHRAWLKEKLHTHFKDLASLQNSGGGE